MANPAKVLNFFDIAGTWDPSLAFVMGGALVTAFDRLPAGVRGARNLGLREAFVLPTASRMIDARLVGGSALFGVGWGISGFCPGGAIPALGTRLHAKLPVHRRDDRRHCRCRTLATRHFAKPAAA